jgi:hypothetical protein
LARRATNVLHLSPRAFFKSRAKLAFLYPLNHARDVFLEALLHFAKLSFEFPNTLLLALDPLGAQFLALFFERMPLGGHLLSQAVQFVPAAMQIGDEVRRFARLRRQQCARAFDNVFGDGEALGDGYAARAARHAHQQTVGGA